MDPAQQPSQQGISQQASQNASQAPSNSVQAPPPPSMPQVPSQQSSQPTSSQPPIDLEHVSREMYKRNLELAERNKTLSLLRKLDELILNSVTDVKETATQVTNLLVNEAEFRLSAIFLLDEDRKDLSLIAFAKPPSLTKEEQDQLERFAMIKSFSTALTNNLLVQVLTDKKVKTTNSLVD